METQKLQGLILGALDSLYDLKVELDKITSEENLTSYVKSRFRDGKSIRQVSNEVGWNFNTLRRYCDRLNIPRPNRSSYKEETNPQPTESHPTQNRAGQP